MGGKLKKLTNSSRYQHYFMYLYLIFACCMHVSFANMVTLDLIKIYHYISEAGILQGHTCEERKVILILNLTVP